MDADTMPWPIHSEYDHDEHAELVAMNYWRLGQLACTFAFFLGMEQGINEKLGTTLLMHHLMVFGGPVRLR